MNSSCLFCRIVGGQEPAAVVQRWDDFTAFLDIRPLFAGHVLLVPNQHLVTLPELPAEARDAFLAHAQVLCSAVVEIMNAQGSFVAINNVVSQSVPHLHLHVVPRTKGDGLRGFFWPRTKYQPGQADEVAARLRAGVPGDLE